MTSPLIHHVSVINRDSKQSFHFYHKILGMDFLLKTVNQDDMDMYHLFFGDTTGRPGTEFSVFEIKDTRAKQFGTNALERTIFAVPSEASLHFWMQRLNDFGIFNCEIEPYNDSHILRFEDLDGVLLGFMPVAQKADETYYPFAHPEIPQEHAIFGIHAVHCRVRYREASIRSFETLFGLQVAKTFVDQDAPITVMHLPGTLFDQELHLIEDRTRDLAEEGVGSIQHIALNAVDDAHLLAIEALILEKNYPYSGIKNREFFKSLYYREPNRMLIEVATEQTHFDKPTLVTDDFDAIPLGLPPFLEDRRAFIESRLR